MQPVVLTEEQRAAFDRDGFLVVPEALPPEMVARLTAAVDRIYERHTREHGLTKTNACLIRNCILEDEVFLELLDWPATVPLVIGLLNWNIQMITSHLVVRAPSPPDADENWKAEGWHRDGGTSSQEMQEPHPRLLIKIAYWLSDLTEPGRGSIRFAPGSNRLIGGLPIPKGASDPPGFVEITAKPGDAVLFEQRTYHAVGPNRSHLTRKSLFFGYGYRWLRPMDYVTMPRELLERCTPIQRQLLGDASYELGYYLPKDEDVPLRAWWQAQQREG
jgi:ectoine hydroxylase-related dioxygenase (phytanoyl-CoA dioxygenase family)